MLGKIDKAYVYIFWVFSRWLSTDFDFSKEWGKWKGALAVDVLVIYTLAIFVNIFLVIFEGIEVPDNLMLILIPLVLVVVFVNKFVLMRQQAKNYVFEFEQQNRIQKRRGSFAVFGFVLFVITMLVFSFWLLSEARQA